MILAVFLAGEAFFLVAKSRQPPQSPTESIDLTTQWETYQNDTYGYTFAHPRMVNGPATIRDDLVEMYEEVEGLILMINIIDVPIDPSAWLATQTIDLYSNKPLSCFSKRELTDIPSIANPKTPIVHFAKPVLFLDNISSPEAIRGQCATIPSVRIVVLQHRGKLFKITFTATPLSEQIVSTIRFNEED